MNYIKFQSKKIRKANSEIIYYENIENLTYILCYKDKYNYFYKTFEI